MELHFPMPMTIRCYGCGKVFDIVLTSEDSHEYPCPACGKVEIFGLGALKEKVVAGNEKIIRKLGRGGNI
jgi:predicted RNA-binding Zn-ribbon protein involved in translation (DUF1610 family)